MPYREIIAVCSENFHMLHFSVRRVTTGLYSKQPSLHFVTHLSIRKAADVAMLTKRYALSHQYPHCVTRH